MTVDPDIKKMLDLRLANGEINMEEYRDFLATVSEPDDVPGHEAPAPAYTASAYVEPPANQAPAQSYPQPAHAVQPSGYPGSYAQPAQHVSSIDHRQSTATLCMVAGVLFCISIFGIVAGIGLIQISQALKAEGQGEENLIKGIRLTAVGVIVFMIIATILNFLLEF